MGHHPPGHGVTAGALTSYLANRVLKKRSSQSGNGAGGGLAEEHELITVVELPLTEIWQAMQDDKVVDMKTLVLLQALMLRRRDLF